MGNKMNIGSNNTLTYLKPISFWFKVFNFLVKKQNRTYWEQYKHGNARYFKISLGVNEYNRIVIKEGECVFRAFSIYDVISFFNRMEDTTVEINLDDEVSIEKENKFKEYCKILELVYQNVRFCGGKRKCDNQIIYHFKHGTPNLINFNDKWWYRLITLTNLKMVKLINKRIIKKYHSFDGFIVLNDI
jgi:hypothetical protein